MKLIFFEAHLIGTSKNIKIFEVPLAPSQLIHQRENQFTSLGSITSR